MTRRRFTEREVLECLLRQGAVIPCYRCRVALTIETARAAEREHLHEVGLDGPDTPENCRFSHQECHSKITNGTPATTAGSSQNRLAKTRSNRADKFRVEKRPLVDDDDLTAPGKCRKCGEFEADCQCKSSFRNRARSVRA